MFYHQLVKQRMKRWGILVAGWAFILLGIAGLFLPVLQGILFLLIGLLILLRNTSGRIIYFTRSKSASLVLSNTWIVRGRDLSADEA